MNNDKNNSLSTRLPWRRMCIGIAIVLILGAIALVWDRWRPTGELTAQDVADITAIIRQRTATPIGGITPKRGGTVQVYVGERGKLGGQIFDVKRSGGAWQITQETLLF